MTLELSRTSSLLGLPLFPKQLKKGQKRNVADALHALGALAKKCAKQKVPDAIQEIFKTTYAQLEEKDTPEKIKIASIATMGIILANFADNPTISKQFQATLGLFSERLRNETTRKVVLRALIKAADSELKLDLRSVITSSLTELTSFMRKSDADLRHITAHATEALIRRHATDLKKDQFETILTETAAHIGDEDLIMASLCLKLVSTALALAPAHTAAQVGKDVVPKAIKLLTSGLLGQGPTLLALIAFFQQAVVSETKVKELSYNALQPALLALVTDTLAKDNVQAIAKCIAGMTRKVADDDANKIIVKFVNDIKGKPAVHLKQIALLSLGEIGRIRDLKSHDGLEKVVFNAFSDPAVQNAAAFALGNISVGNLDHYLPILLDLISKQEDRLYLLLSSLNEIIKAEAEDKKTR
jgi:cullin-associated NEDD8-dissociated protein 1